MISWHGIADAGNGIMTKNFNVIAVISHLYSVVDMGLLERKVNEIIGGRNLSRREARGELAARFRLNKKEADSILKDMRKKGHLLGE